MQLSSSHQSSREFILKSIHKFYLLSKLVQLMIYWIVSPRFFDFLIFCISKIEPGLYSWLFLSFFFLCFEFVMLSFFFNHYNPILVWRMSRRGETVHPVLNASWNNMMSRKRKQSKRYKRWSQMDGRTSMKIAWCQLMPQCFSFNILLTLFELPRLRMGIMTTPTQSH